MLFFLRFSQDVLFEDYGWNPLLLSYLLASMSSIKDLHDSFSSAMGALVEKIQRLDLVMERVAPSRFLHLESLVCALCRLLWYHY